MGHGARRQSQAGHLPQPGGTPTVRLWAHGRFGYQDVVLLLLPLAGLTLLLLSTVILPGYFENAPRQAGTVTVSACHYFEEDRDNYKCTGSFQPDNDAAPLTPPPHIWVGEGDLTDPGSSERAELFGDDTLRIEGEDAVDPFLGLGVILSAVGLPIVVIYARNFVRYRNLRRRHPRQDVLDRRGWPGASADSEASRDASRTRAVRNRFSTRIFFALAIAGVVGVGGVLLWEAVAPGRSAASVTVGWCTDSADLSGPGMRPLVTCWGTSDDGTEFEFSAAGRKYLEPGTRVNGRLVDGRFIDGTGGIGAEPLFPALVVLIPVAILVGLVARANTLELRRLSRATSSEAPDFREAGSGDSRG